MSRLLWKDYRESWPLGMLLVVCTMVCIHISGGYPIVNLWQPISIWITLPVAVGVLLGFTAQTSDISQPINNLMATLSTKASRALAAHTITALSYVLLSSLAGYCLFSFTCPQPYRQLLQNDNRLYGLFVCMCILAGAWYCGFCVRSLWSSLPCKLIMLLWLCLVTLVIMIRISAMNIVAMAAFSSVILLLLVLMPGVLLAINIHMKERDTRSLLYVKGLLIVLLAFTIWRMVDLYQYAVIYSGGGNSASRVSPTGEYAVIPVAAYDWRHGSYVLKTQLFRLNPSSTIAEIPNTDASDTPQWITANSLAIIGNIKGLPSLSYMKIEKNQNITPTSLQLKYRDFIAYGSADGRYIMVASDPNRPMLTRIPDDDLKEIERLIRCRKKTHPNNPSLITVKMSISHFRVFDTLTRRWATEYILMNHCQWVDSNTISYTDFFGDRQVLRLPVTK